MHDTGGGLEKLEGEGESSRLFIRNRANSSKRGSGGGSCRLGQAGGTKGQKAEA